MLLLALGPRVLHCATARDPAPHPSLAAACSTVGGAARCLGVSRGSDGGHGTRRGVGGGRGVRAEAAYFWDVSVPVEMGEIHSMDTLDAALASFVDHNQPTNVDWMASWCRKCIYLKPKMEKIAGEFPRVRFYFVDVNKVPHVVVKRV
ncbi:thioredoxin-like 3-1, chloroplastic [Hordeum vulgare subsp. vulgare]|uniref:thioredoxin-like 3-1, chloroplastic n=1 Tax=Hordeum vulgare subsp. vulgare TaxID=112509 RepID=UPI001D1A4BEA|nr:thioredoxin-like 3-1, chloroplastic [Hordeum vulgare subsp. vulgare]